MVTAETMVAGLPAVSSDASLGEAARLLRETGLSVLPVRTGRHVVGSISERDLALKCWASGCDPAETIVADVMHEDLTLCPASAPAEVALELMISTGVTAVIVHNGEGRVVGMATLPQVVEGLRRPAPEGPVPNSVKRVRGEPV